MKRTPISLKHRRGGDQVQAALNDDRSLQCAKLDLLRFPVIRTALDHLSMKPLDHQCRSLVDQSIRHELIRNVLNPQPFEKANRAAVGKVSGPLKLGVINNTKDIFGIHPSSLNEHMWLVSRSGGGKTSCLKNLLRQLLSSSDKE